MINADKYVEILLQDEGFRKLCKEYSDNPLHRNDCTPNELYDDCLCLTDVHLKAQAIFHSFEEEDFSTVPLENFKPNLEASMARYLAIGKAFQIINSQQYR